MFELSNQARSAAPGAKGQAHAKASWLAGLIALVLLLGLCPARADDADDQYFRAYGLIQQADDLSANGKRVPARAKYLEAYTILKNFKQSYPEWNAQLVATRLKYLTQQITALSEQPAEAVASSATNAPTAKIEPKPAPPASSGPVKLLSAGAEPRTALRLHPTVGDKQALLLNTKVALETKMSGGQESPTKLPSASATLDIPAEITIKEVSAKGDITFEVMLGDVSGAEEPPGGSPPAANAKKSSVGGVKGLSATGSISSQGLSKGFDFKAPEGANLQTRLIIDLLKDIFLQLVTPLPEQPVGVGAKWEVKTPVQAHTIKIDQSANYELVSAEGERLKTKSTSTQRAANQKMDNPILPGTQVDLTKWAFKTSGEFGLDTGKLMPTSGTMELHSEMGMGLNMGGQSQGIIMKIDVNLSIEGK
jgi:hypothetical protein